MMIDEQDLASRLHQLADRDGTGPAPVANLVRQGRRSRATRTALYTTGATAVIAVVAVAVGVAGNRPAGPAAPVAGPERVSLALAAQTTSAAPFHFTASIADADTHVVAIELTGVADPVAGRSQLQDTHHVKFVEERRIGGQCYVQPAVDQGFTAYACPPGSGSLGTDASLTGNPMAVLDQLEASGAATYAGRTGTGSSTVDTWKFSYTTPVVDGSTPITSAGTATVDVATSQVTNVTFQAGAAAGAPPAPGGDGVAHQTITFAFSDYGTPVTVVAPPVG
jgi:hypothetical protein